MTSPPSHPPPHSQSAVNTSRDFDVLATVTPAVAVSVGHQPKNWKKSPLLLKNDNQDTLIMLRMK